MNDEAARPGRPATTSPPRLPRGAAQARPPALHLVLTLDAAPHLYISADTLEDEVQLRTWARADRRASAVLDALGVAA